MPTSYCTRRTVSVLRRSLQIAGSFVIAVAAYGTLYLLATRPRAGTALSEDHGIRALAMIALFSVALVATFRTIEGSFVWPWGKVSFRAGGVTVLLYLLCFGVGVVALTLVKTVDKLPSPLWQQRAPVQAQVSSTQTGAAPAATSQQAPTNP